MLMNGHYRAEMREESRRGGEESEVATEGAVMKKEFNLHLRFL